MKDNQLILGYIQKAKTEIKGHDPLYEAKRFRYSYYNPKGEPYISLVVEYKNGLQCIHRYKFNCNMFVGNRVDHTVHFNPGKETINKELRKDAYKSGTGIRKYIEVI